MSTHSSINLETISSKAFGDLLKLDMSYAGTEDYMGMGYFWSHDYRHTGLRSTSVYKRRRVHTEFLKAGLEVSGTSTEHEEIIRRILGPKSI